MSEKQFGTLLICSLVLAAVILIAFMIGTDEGIALAVSEAIGRWPLP